MGFLGGTLGTGDVDRLQLDVLATLLDCCLRQGQEIRLTIANLRFGLDVYVSIVHIFNSRLGGRNIANPPKEGTRSVLMIAPKYCEVPLARGRQWREYDLGGGEAT